MVWTFPQCTKLGSITSACPADASMINKLITGLGEYHCSYVYRGRSPWLAVRIRCCCNAARTCMLVLARSSRGCVHQRKGYKEYSLCPPSNTIHYTSRHQQHSLNYQSTSSSNNSLQKIITYLITSKMKTSTIISATTGLLASTVTAAATPKTYSLKTKSTDSRFDSICGACSSPFIAHHAPCPSLNPTHPRLSFNLPLPSLPP